MELKRDQIENFSSDGLFGKLILKNENQEITLFTKEKTFNLRFKWPFGKPLDSCILDGNYNLTKQFCQLYNTDEIYLYNLSKGVYLSSKDMPSSICRYGCILTHNDILNVAEGSIQLGMSIATKSNKYVLIETQKAYNIFRQWIDNNPDDTVLNISWGKEKII